jgi:hypothetical protein
MERNRGLTHDIVLIGSNRFSGAAPDGPAAALEP